MIKVIELRKIIKTALKSIHPHVHYQSAPDGSDFPYLVYDLPNSIDDGSLEQFVLDVDAWDVPANGDTTTVETLIDSADKALHRKTITVNNELAVTFYRENRLPLTDDDPKIKRIKYTYEARTFERR
ncbi:tail completion protein gp17 [Salipaludibacillus sp. CF4.18]|uniref:tail completion protein gp17 n=1 Tax=Salipaludibacillus sp. CF4.18 TaxID=3373081 RepID=UPI003EE45452